jgi:transcriptional regulator with XRE-family HTH domain
MELLNMGDLGNKEVMADNIKANMYRLGIERVDLAKSLEVPYPTVSDWVNAKTYPRIDRIEQMANLFKISKADLIEKDPATNKGSGTKALDDDLIKRLCNLSPDKVEIVRAFVQGLESGNKD